MTLTITNKYKNNLLARTRVEAESDFGEKATPSNVEIAKEIAHELKSKESLVKVRHIYTQYRKNKAKIKAYVYDNEDAVKKIEIIPRKQRRAEQKAAEEARKKAVEEKKKAVEEKQATSAEEKKE
ncbi:hypothetical protein J4410_03810 [Candidatus Woesearchaeota archaeon]|nr:hypothetical protein [Candidatus Woesearchaeota archaeon]